MNETDFGRAFGNNVLRAGKALGLTVGLALGLAACGGGGGERQSFGADGTPPSSITGGVAESRAGTTYDVVLDSAVDGEAIAFTVHEPEMLEAGQTYPLILHSHGYGGARQATRPGAASFIGQFLVNGYGVLSLDERGHNESGGFIRILDPDFEGNDWLQTLDWTEENLEWMAFSSSGPDTGSGRGNPVMGAIGGSYGGGYQHLIWAIDNKDRLDAIAPDITWNDLRYSLFSNEVFKSGWATLLSGLGNRAPNRQDTEVNQGLARGLATNTLSDTELALLYKDSLASHCAGDNMATRTGGLRAIDSFMTQSHLDTLFNLNDAVRNYDCVRALGGDVRMFVKAQGHGLENGDGGENCGSLERQQATLSWFDEKLRGQSGAASDIPNICFNLGREGADGVVLSSIPTGGTTTTQAVAMNFNAQENAQAVVPVDIYTAPAGGVVLAGIPTIALNVAATLAEGAVEPIVFVGLGVRPAGGANPSDSFNNQLSPFLGYGDFAGELVGVSQRLAEGDTVVALFYSGDPAQYAGSGTAAPTPVNLTADIELPVIANPPAAP